MKTLKELQDELKTAKKQVEHGRSDFNRVVGERLLEDVVKTREGRQQAIQQLKQNEEIEKAVQAEEAAIAALEAHMTSISSSSAATNSPSATA